MNKQDFLNRFILQNAVYPATSSNSLISLQKIKIQFKKAAVLMPLVQRKNGLNMILAKRALHLKYHAGQISFPGGKYESNDDSLAQTALRETEEEIGIKQRSIKIIGTLPPLTTLTGYHITPFIGFVEATEKNSY